MYGPVSIDISGTRWLDSVCRVEESENSETTDQNKTTNLNVPRPAETGHEGRECLDAVFGPRGRSH